MVPLPSERWTMMIAAPGFSLSIAESRQIMKASLLASCVPEHISYRVITESDRPVLTIAYLSGLQNADVRRFCGACEEGLSRFD